MKSKKAILLIAAVLVVFLIWKQWSSRVFARALENEWIENIDTASKASDSNADSWQVMPFGYTLGAWPVYFHGEPIVMKMTYQKGPPKKFIQTMTQVWRPVEVELSMQGPHTVDAKLGAIEWKSCFSSTLLCHSEKNAFLQATAQDLVTGKNGNIETTWIDSLDPTGVRGVHYHVNRRTYSIDRYSLISEKGVVQSFSLKYANDPLGSEAKQLFVQILGGLKVKDDLPSARAWIQSKIQTVNLNQIRSIPTPKLRMVKMIEVQNWIFSLLSVDPSGLGGFFHLGGVTHLLAMELMKASQKGEDKIFENQEAWILNSKPQLETLIAYAKDFPDSTEAVKNLEALLQDVLLVQQKMSGRGIR